ncbi:luciferase domain-containing protein [Streptomyces lydicus]|uniref:luciferase domain-containing protein n=1 Tax=Streptomyces lydicus TaxID=47763 RepID=UPI0037B2FEAB
MFMARTCVVGVDEYATRKGQHYGTVLVDVEDNLRGSSAIRLVPDSHWVTIHLECNADIDLLLTLVSVALQAHQQWPDTGDASAARCNDRHGGRARELAGSGQAHLVLALSPARFLSSLSGAPFSL